MKTRREAAFLAAAAEIEPYLKAKLAGASRKEKLELRAAEMRANRILEQLGSTGSLPEELKTKLQFWMEMR